MDEKVNGVQAIYNARRHLGGLKNRLTDAKEKVTGARSRVTGCQKEVDEASDALDAVIDDVAKGQGLLFDPASAEAEDADDVLDEVESPAEEAEPVSV